MSMKHKTETHIIKTNCDEKKKKATGSISDLKSANKKHFDEEYHGLTYILVASDIF